MEKKYFAKIPSDCSFSHPFSVVDSWSKLPTRIKYGNTFDLGSFDQCLQTYQKTDQVEIIGQHCLFQFYSKSNETIPKDFHISSFNYGWKGLDRRFGGAICLPAACAPGTVNKVLHLLLHGSDYAIADDYDQADYCKTSPKSSITISLIVISCIVSFLLLCVILSTVYDLRTVKTDPDKKNQWLLVFSLYTNASILFDCSTKSASEVKNFHFFRTVVSIIIVLAHVYGTVVWFPMSNHYNIEDAFYTKVIQISACFLHMFLVISGFLASKTIMKKLEE